MFTDVHIFSVKITALLSAIYRFRVLVSNPNDAICRKLHSILKSKLKMVITISYSAKLLLLMLLCIYTSHNFIKIVSDSIGVGTPKSFLSSS